MIEVTEDFIRDFYKQIGYAVEHVAFTGRSAVATLEKNNKKYFSKFARRAEVSSCLKNELVWNQMLNEPSKKWVVYIPQVFESGLKEDRFWFVREQLPGKALADQDLGEIHPQYLEKYLRPSVDFLLTLPRTVIKLPNDSLPQFQYYQNVGPTPEVIAKGATETLAKIKISLPQAVELIRRTPLVKLGLAHTDYKPWHLFSHDEGLALIDGENANNMMPIHYDISSYFARLITILNREDIAFAARDYYEGRMDNKGEFRQYFTSLVAMVAIGELKDASDKGRLEAGHHKMIELIEANSLFQDQAY